MTEDKVELGRHLFYDPRLSGNGSQSCRSCHDPSLAFADAAPLSTGATGQTTRTNSPGLQNVAYYANFTWAQPDLDSLEAQIHLPLFGDDPVELGSDDAVLYDRLSGDPVYADLFAAAWPDDPHSFSADQTVDALASFVRSMVSADSPFDRVAYLVDDQAMDDAQLRGMNLFFSERMECFHCHTAPQFSRSMRTQDSPNWGGAFDNNGLYNIDGEGGYPPSNNGLADFTGLPEDIGRFRPPSLRNVALTAPYMHDGSLATLREVVEMYAAGGLVLEEGRHAGDGRANPNKSGFVSGFEISEDEMSDLLAFLGALTDTTFLDDPAYADPWEDPP
jgi:cytochrome c peroxidase